MFFTFFFNDTATTEIYTLSLHDALPIFEEGERKAYSALIQDYQERHRDGVAKHRRRGDPERPLGRSEEHTSELQSRRDLVCRLLLEKKKKKINIQNNHVYTQRISFMYNH